MIDIAATNSSPLIRYVPETALLEFDGESYPENSFAFFAPVFAWLNAEFGGLDRLRVEINIPYMNSSSTKCMLDILDILSESVKSGREIRVVWFYESGNDRALELAEEFKEDVGLPFEIVPYDAGKR